MTSTNAFQYEMWFERALGLLNDWKKHKAGDHEVQEAYPLEYIGANLVEQVERIWRLNLSSERVEELNKNFLPCLEGWRGSLLEESLKGAEVVSFEALLDDVFDSIDFSLKVEEDPELDFDLKDEITDCLIKRDGLHLIMNFVERESAHLQEDFKSKVTTLLDERMAQISKLDKRIRESIDIFALTSDFCLNYARANNISDESLYWWLFEPINRAVDANIVSLLSLKSRFLKPTDDQRIKDLATFLNVEVQKKESESDNDTEGQNSDSSDQKTLRPISTEEPAEPSHVEEEVYEYALAASSQIDEDLQPAVYALVVNTKTGKVEHHKIVGLLGSDQYSSKDLAPDIQKIFRNIPTIAQAKFNVPVKKFNVDLGNTTEGCTGESIGLGAFLEYLVASELLVIDKPVAATGDLQFDGEIRKVSDINEKISLALTAGFKLILVPKENETDLQKELRSSDAVRFVANVKEAESSLRIYEISHHENAVNAIKELNIIKIRLRDEGFSVSEIKEGEWHHYLDVSGLGDNAKVMVYYNSKFIFKKPRVQGGKPNGALSIRLNELISTRVTSSEESTSESTHVTAKVKVLDSSTKSKIQTFLQKNFAENLQVLTENGCEYRYDIIKGEKTVIKQYKNGTLFLDGTSGELWTEIINAIYAVSQIRVNVTEEKQTADVLESLLPAGITTWIGVDEAGKGDYFGPLVTASVLVDPSNIEQLSNLGIRDSKLRTDTRNIELGEKIRSICGDKCYVLATMPEKYNQLLEEPPFEKDSQRLLAWQHRRAIENILLKYECQYAICDQFGPEDLIREGLKTGKGTQIEIIQRPKAEVNLAVAAASVLARREFLVRLQKMSSEYGVSFPKGASDFDSILKTARMLMEKRGKDILAKVAKVHFKTTKKIMEQLGK